MLTYVVAIGTVPATAGIVIGVRKVIAVAAGFFAALLNLAAEGNVMLRMALFCATTASGVLTFRLAVF